MTRKVLSNGDVAGMVWKLFGRLSIATAVEVEKGVGLPASPKKKEDSRRVSRAWCLLWLGGVRRMSAI